MGYLGLDQTDVKDDNMFQRLFWPSDHAGEADSLGKQGFWMCLGIGVLTFLQSTLQGHWILGLLTLLVYALGGMGVREHSQPAAVLLAAGFTLNAGAGLAMGMPPGVLGLFGFVLLWANVRGTWIAAKWAANDRTAMPERFSETFRDRLVDQLPARLWPRLKIVFFALAGVYVLLTLLGIVALALRLTPHARPQTPAAQYSVPVEPSR